MEYGFSILMFCFAGALLLYAGLLAAEKRRPDLLIPRQVSVSKSELTVAYARRLAKIVALCALSPLLTGLVGLTGYYLIAGIVFVVTLAGAIWLGVKLTRGQTEE